MTLTESYIAGPTTPAVRDVTLGQMLEQAARSAPDRLALIAGISDPALRRQWTYSELYTEAQRTARALLHRFKLGERIAVWAQNLPEWIMLEFGAGLAGMVLVTVNPGFRARELEYVLKQSRSLACSSSIPSVAIRCWRRCTRSPRAALNYGRSSVSTTGRPSSPPATTSASRFPRSNRPIP